VIAWRLDQEKYAASWDTGEGARLFGGRWNSPAVSAVYCSFDPSTAIAENAVHKGFRVLDTQPHVLSAVKIIDVQLMHVVYPKDVPNPNWMFPGIVTPGQQSFGDRLLEEHPFVAIPSVVSRSSWNLIFAPRKAAGLYALVEQSRFALDPRLVER
jgi:RES domain-containing protein